MHDERWFEFCTPHLQELNPKVDLDPEPYVKDMVDRAEAIGSDTLIFMADEGGRAVYPSRLLPASDHLRGADLLGMVEKEVHARGLRFGAGFLGIHTNSYCCEAHPEWMQRDIDGQPLPFYSASLLCPNTPYQRYYTEYVREVVTRYPVDMIYVEGVYFRNTGCFCPYCREKFQREYDRDLRDSRDAPAFQRFRQDSCERFHARISRMVRDLSPRTVISGCCYIFMARTCRVSTFREHHDVCALENQWGMVDLQWGNYPALREAGLSMLMLKSGARRPMIGSWWCGRQVDLDYAPRAAAHARLTYIETMMYGAAVQPHLQTAFEVDRALMPVLTELNTLAKKVRPYLLDARLMPYAAIYDWAGSGDAKNFCNAALKGVYDALIEHHVPLDVVSVEDLDTGRLADYRVVILPEAVRLSQGEIDGLRLFVERGGGLVFTGCTGARDEQDAVRGTNPLLEMAGVRAEGMDVPVRLMMGGAWDNDEPNIVFNVYYRIDSDAALWNGIGRQYCSFRTTYVNVVPTAADVEVQASIYDLDYTRTHRDHMIEGAYPGAAIGPMIVTRQVGGGRVAYVAGDIGAAAWDAGDVGAYTVIARLACWAAAEDPPLRTGAPGSVELVTHVKAGSLLVFVVNQATNPPGKIGTIRYVTPQHDLAFTIAAPGKVKAVRAATGQSLDWTADGDQLTVRIPALAEYEAVMIDLGSVR
ncbi:beta-galactosidase trimerization domain-containing protein [Verrucomicrobiota bacterium]